MTAPRLALAVVLVVVASTVGVGATAAAGGTWPSSSAPATVAANESDAPPMGANVSMFMQANAAQAAGTVENGMWVAAYARTGNATDRRALVERRMGSMNATLADLEAQRRAIQEAYRNGTIDRVTYRSRLSTIVGRLAALSEGIEETSVRGEAVGVNRTRLEALRSQARELGGGEVSRIARNLSAGQGPPGRADVFGDGRPGPPDDPANRSNRTGEAGGPGDADDGAPADGGNRSADGGTTGGEGGSGQGPPEDRGRSGQGSAAEATDTPTPDDGY